MPRALLINPWIYDFAAYDMWAKPLGLLYIAACLRKNGYDVTYLDCLNIEHPKMEPFLRHEKLRKTPYGSRKFYKEFINPPDFLKFVPRRYGRYGIKEEIFTEELQAMPRPDVILVTSMMTYWYPGPFRVVELVKQQFPDIPVILGGVYATLCHVHAKQKSGADYVISGEAEIEAVKLCDQLTGWKSTFFPDSENLDSYPYPAFDLMQNPKYTCIQTTRGCPFRCTYCAQDKIIPTYRKRTPLHVAEEITYFYNSWGVRHFIFYDDALTIGSKSLLAPLLNEVIRRKLDVTFHTPNGMHIRGINTENARLMRRAGFKTIRISLETVDVVRQKESGGKTTNEEFVECCQYLHEAGFQPQEIGVYLLAGLPGQEKSEVEESIQFVLEHGAYPYLSKFTPIPGTPMFDEAKKWTNLNLEHEPLFQNNSILPCAWERFTADDLKQLKLQQMALA